MRSLTKVHGGRRRRRAGADRLRPVRRHQRLHRHRQQHRRHGRNRGFAADALIGVALPAEDLGELGPRRATCSTTASPRPASRPTCSTPTVGVVAEQQNQIQAMVTKGAKVIVIGAIDGAQLGTQVKAAKDAGATVIAYDRLIKNTADRRLLRRVRQLQGRRAAGPGAARRHGGQEGRRPVQHRAVRRLARRRQRPGLLRRRHERPEAEDRRRHAQGRLRPDGLQAGGHPGLEGRERAEAHGHPSLGVLLVGRPSTACSRRTTPWPARSSRRSRPPASPSRSSPVRTPRSSRSSRSWPASSTPRSTRTPATSSRRPSRWSQALQKGEKPTVNDDQVLQQRRQGRPGLPARPGHRHQGERGRGLRQRPDAVPAHQVS